LEGGGKVAASPQPSPTLLLSQGTPVILSVSEESHYFTG
jgi:hypothetical protein